MESIDEVVTHEVLAPTWREWYQGAVERLGKETKKAPLTNKDWKVVYGQDGEIEEIAREDGKFFKVVGINAGFDQPFIEPVFDPEDPKERQGIVVMFVDKESGDMLLSTVFESGSNSIGGVTIRPTIQHSFSNIAMNGYPFSDMFGSQNIPQFDEKLMQLGGVRKNKQIDPGRIGNYNLYGILPVDRNSIDLSEMPNHRWITQNELEEIEAEETLVTAQFGTVNEIRLEWMMKNSMPLYHTPQAATLQV